MPGNDLLSHVLRQSTIGAEGLDFRVRDGIGYYPFAIITRQCIYIIININCKQIINNLLVKQNSSLIFKIWRHGMNWSCNLYNVNLAFVLQLYTSPLILFESFSVSKFNPWFRVCIQYELIEIPIVLPLVFVTLFLHQL